MRTPTILIAAVVLAIVSVLPGIATAEGVYELPFLATHNAPEGAEGVMRIVVRNGRSVVRLRVRGLYPHTVYTIWTVFNKLTWKPTDPPTGHSIASCPATGVFSSPTDQAACEKAIGGPWKGWTNFPLEGGGVAPTAKMSARFTDGMGLDPGATFITDENGDGHVTVQLDYDILANDQETGPPIGNADIIRQTVPVATCDRVTDAAGNVTTTCSKKSLRVTSTYLRRFIAEVGLGERAEKCANYEPIFDPDNAAYDPEHAGGADARLWQCVHPASNLPRVPRYGFDHFRLANHVDHLTHGFIGGNATDHSIDMVGRRGDVVPRGSSEAVEPLVPAATP